MSRSNNVFYSSHVMIGSPKPLDVAASERVLGNNSCGRSNNIFSCKRFYSPT